MSGGGGSQKRPEGRSVHRLGAGHDRHKQISGSVQSEIMEMDQPEGPTLEVFGLELDEVVRKNPSLRLLSSRRNHLIQLVSRQGFPRLGS